MSCSKQLLAFFLWYHCWYLYVNGTPITATANKVTLTPGQEIALSCKIAEYPDAQFIWLKQRKFPLKDQTSPNYHASSSSSAAFSPTYDEDKKEIDRSDDRYNINNNVMIIKSSTIADVGDYFCQVKEQLDGVAESEKMISVRPKPFIYDFELHDSTPRSAIVEEGTTLKIPCNVVDEYFSPESINVSWHMSKYDENDMNDVNSGEDGIRIEVHNRTSQELIIDKVTKDHRRLYKCQVSNGVTENSKSILIRVKDKYTVAWPALGIIIELVILIGVIFVVENRKVEPDKQDAYDRKAIQM